MCLPGGYPIGTVQEEARGKPSNSTPWSRDGGGTKLVGMACGRLGQQTGCKGLGSPVSNVQLANSAGSPRRRALGVAVGFVAELGSGVGLRGLTTDG
jgi:hypothetical protein